MGIGFAQQFHFAIGHREAVGQEALDGHISTLVLAPVDERSVAPFTENDIRIEQNLANLKKKNWNKMIIIFLFFFVFKK